MSGPTIYLAFTDDWELRGDGSGDIHEIQFRAMRELTSAFDEAGIPCTFMVEVMQQLAFKARSDEFSSLREAADRWDEHVLSAHSRGHDIQLHIHPQWSESDYQGGKWSLKGDWALTSYSAPKANSMISAGKAYLEGLIRPVDPEYSCIAFRAGASAIAPGEHLLPTLAANGIRLDISIIDGYRASTPNLQLDFSVCEEGRLPYYPDMSDARKVSTEQQPIVCMPLFEFRGSRRASARDVVGKVMEKARRAKAEVQDYSSGQWAQAGGSRLSSVMEKVIRPVTAGKRMVGDIGKLGDVFLPEVLPTIRRRARQSGLSAYPAVLSNHSKYVNDFGPIRRFLGTVRSAPDVEFVTLTQLARMLSQGDIPVKTAA